MKQKHIDAMREARLWVAQIVVPGIIIGYTICQNQEAKNYITDKYQKVKNSLKDFFSKN